MYLNGNKMQYPEGRTSKNFTTMTAKSETFMFE